MGATYRVILSARAFADLNEILDYIAKDSPPNAGLMVDRLWEACQSLRAFPQRHRVVQGGRRETRAMPEPPYLIYYRVLDSQQTVRVITIRHGARRRPRRCD